MKGVSLLFSFGSIAIFGKFIKIHVSVFPDPSGRVVKFSPVPDDGEKLGGTFKKKIKSIPPQELF